MTEQTEQTEPPRYQVKGLVVYDIPANMVVRRCGSKEQARKVAESLNRNGSWSR